MMGLGVSVTNSIAKAMNSTANEMNTTAKVLNFTANWTESTAKVTNSIAKTYNYYRLSLRVNPAIHSRTVTPVFKTH